MESSILRSNCCADNVYLFSLLWETSVFKRTTNVSIEACKYAYVHEQIVPYYLSRFYGRLPYTVFPVCQQAYQQRVDVSDC